MSTTGLFADYQPRDLVKVWDELARDWSPRMYVARVHADRIEVSYHLQLHTVTDPARVVKVYR